MSEKKVNIIEQLLDDTNVENIVLYNDKNEKMEFEQIAIIPLTEKNITRGFAMLKPVKLIKGMKKDEAVLFEIDIKKDVIRLVSDQKLIDKVFDEYKKLFDAAK